MSIKEIAERAGTSVSTVSRVLSKPDYKCTSPELQKKILKIAREMDYVPNEAARNLKLQQKRVEKNWYFHVLNTRTGDMESDPYYGEILRFISVRVHEKSYTLSNVWYAPGFAVDKIYDSKESNAYLEKLLKQSEGKRDGLIILGHCKKNILEKLKAEFKAVIMVVRNGPDYDVGEILTDGRRIAELAVGHLVGLGHKKIGYVGDCKFDSVFQGFLETMARYNITLDQNCIIESGRTEADGFHAMEQFLQMEEKPTGIFCLNDIIAIGALRCLNKKKSRYYRPSVISSDGIEEGKYTKPMLTTVEIPKEDMANLAVDLLIGRLEGQHSTYVRIELDGKLVVRESTKRVNEGEVEYYI